MSSVNENKIKGANMENMLLRIVHVTENGHSNRPFSVHVHETATVQDVKVAIGLHDQVLDMSAYQLLWLQPSCNEKFNLNTNAKILKQEESLLDLGIQHGDKLHMESNRVASSLLQLSTSNDVTSGMISLSAERRHDVQESIKFRENDIKERIAATQLLVKEALQKWNGRQSKEEMITTSSSLRKRKNAAISKEEPPPPALQDLKQQVSNLKEAQTYLDIPFSDIRILPGKVNELGLGKAATVYRGLWMNASGNAEVAIKAFRYFNLTDKIKIEFQQEVAMLRKLTHPNIVLFLGACVSPKLYILTEFCSRKSLYDVLHRSVAFSTMPWKYKVRMMLDAARGIEYLHSKNIIHRDIKSHNFLIDEDWRLKVADFGISKVLKKGDSTFTQCGTSGWVAPEVLAEEDDGYTSKADNWSFAIVMWEMINVDAANPFLGMAPVTFYQQAIKDNIRPLFKSDVDVEYKNLIETCWDSNPTKRPTFSKIVASLETQLTSLGLETHPPLTFPGKYPFQDAKT